MRIIASTNRALCVAAARGEFRADLYDRLNGITLTVPSLRARLDDIPRLVDHFLATHARDSRDLRLTPRVRRALIAYHWPGNVRELELAMRRATLQAERGVVRIGTRDCPKSPGGRRGHGSPIASGGCSGWLERRAAWWRQHVVARLAVSREPARQELVALTRVGLLQRVGRGRGTHYRVIDGYQEERS